MDIYSLMVLGHIIGTVLGVGAATFVEILIINALYEGKTDPDKTLILQVSYNVLRIGLFLLVLSGMGFLLYARIEDFPSPMHSPQFWVKLGIIGVLVIGAMLQQLRLIPRAWGSAIAIASWYGALILGVLHSAEFPVTETIFVYLLSIVILFYIFSKLQSCVTRKLTDNIS